MDVIARRTDRCGRRVGHLLIAGAAVLLPWAVALAFALPQTASVRRWSVAWVGLDVMQALGLAATGWLWLRRHAAVGLLAGVTAGLLLVDAWFDTATAATGRDYLVALTSAAMVELPLAGLCLVVGYRATSRGRQPPWPASRVTDRRARR
jgi:hypothetical protein